MGRLSHLESDGLILSSTPIWENCLTHLIFSFPISKANPQSTYFIDLLWVPKACKLLLIRTVVLRSHWLYDFWLLLFKLLWIRSCTSEGILKDGSLISYFRDFLVQLLINIIWRRARLLWLFENPCGFLSVRSDKMYPYFWPPPYSLQHIFTVHNNSDTTLGVL